MPDSKELAERITRRRFAQGLGGIALASLLARDGWGSSEPWHPPDGKAHFQPRAKSVIWLFMRGGVSHLESFDPKPELDKYAGLTIAATPYREVADPARLKKNQRVVVVNDANGQQRPTLYPTQVGFKKYGLSGIEVSDWFPRIGSCADDLAVIRSMWTTDDNHGAQIQFQSGRHMLDGLFPTIGAWVNYGLGSMNDSLPAFITMGPRFFEKRDAHYLGPAYEAVELKIDPANPLAFARPERDLSTAEQRAQFSLLEKLHRLAAARSPGDAALEARIKSYHLAYRMQTAVPEVIDFNSESAAVKRLYGLDHTITRPFGQQLLAARRFVERGVRFVQIFHGDGAAGAWDAHSSLKANHAGLAAQVDQPVAGLLVDLKQRGLFDETIVVFATEFGRTPGAQGGDGRDHHIYGFSVWMAGGGIKGGLVHGRTDELGFHAVENRHYVTDIHATLMHLLGLDARRLELPSRRRLAIDFGEPITDIIA